MLKINPINLTLFCMFLMGIPQETMAMNRLAQWLKNCGKFGTSLAIATGCTHEYLTNYKLNTEIDRAFNLIIHNAQQNPQPKTIAFVLETLQKAYPQLDTQNIKIIPPSPQYKAQFSIEKHGTTYFLHVPLTDQELERGLMLKSKGPQELPHEAIAQELKKNNINWTVPQWAARMEYIGLAYTSTALDVWKGAIIHEGSRIHTNDLTHLATLNHTLNGATLLACVKNMHTFSPLLLASACIARTLAPQLVQYWQLYRADQKTIKNIEDPAVLMALSKNWQNLPPVPVQHTTWHAKFNQAIKLRPSNALRADYFAHAAQQLENQQGNKI